MMALLARLNWRVIAWVGALVGVLVLMVALYFSIRDAALQQGRAEVQRAWDREKAAAAEHKDWIEGDLRRRAESLDAATAEQLNRIEVAERTIIQPIREEIQREVRYRDPDCSVSDGVLAAINASRDLSADSSAVGER